MLSNLIAAVVCLAITYLALSYYLGYFPSPRMQLGAIPEQPAVEWYARAIPRESSRRSHPFLLEPDLVQTRYQVIVTNHGEVASRATRIVIETTSDIVGVRGFGAVELQTSNGAWVGIGATPRDEATSRRRAVLQVPMLNPTEEVQVDIVLDRAAGTEWQFPSTVVTFERGAARMATPRSDLTWR